MTMRAAALFLLLAGCAGGAAGGSGTSTAADGTTPAEPGQTPDGSPGDASQDGNTGNGESAGDEGTPEAPSTPPPPGPFNETRVRDIVREHYEAVGECYANGLARDPSIAGVVEVHFSVNDVGVVVSASAPRKAGKTKDGDTRLVDAEVVGCIEELFMGLRFPATERGLVPLVYPVVLRVE